MKVKQYWLLHKHSLRVALLLIIGVKLVLWALLSMGVWGQPQTQGITMQLPLEQVQDQLLGPPPAVTKSVPNNSTPIKP